MPWVVAPCWDKRSLVDRMGEGSHILECGGVWPEDPGPLAGTSKTTTPNLTKTPTCSMPSDHRNINIVAALYITQDKLYQTLADFGYCTTMFTIHMAI